MKEKEVESLYEEIMADEQYDTKKFLEKKIKTSKSWMKAYVCFCRNKSAVKTELKDLRDMGISHSQAYEILTTLQRMGFLHPPQKTSRKNIYVFKDELFENMDDLLKLCKNSYGDR